MLFNLFFCRFILIFLPIIEINCGKNLGPVNLYFCEDWGCWILCPLLLFFLVSCWTCAFLCLPLVLLYSLVSSLLLAVWNIFYNLFILNSILYIMDVTTSGERSFFLTEDQMLESVAINIFWQQYESQWWHFFVFGVPVLHCCLITSAIYAKCIWNGAWILFLQDVLKWPLCSNGLYETKLKDTGNTPGIIILSLASLLPASAFRSLR